MLGPTKRDELVPCPVFGGSTVGCSTYALLRAQVSTVGARMAAKKFEAEGYPIYPANVSVSCGIE